MFGDLFGIEKCGDQGDFSCPEALVFDIKLEDSYGQLFRKKIMFGSRHDLAGIFWFRPGDQCIVMTQRFFSWEPDLTPTV